MTDIEKLITLVLKNKLLNKPHLDYYDLDSLKLLINIHGGKIYSVVPEIDTLLKKNIFEPNKSVTYTINKVKIQKYQAPHEIIYDKEPINEFVQIKFINGEQIYTSEYIKNETKENEVILDTFLITLIDKINLFLSNSLTKTKLSSEIRSSSETKLLPKIRSPSITKLLPEIRSPSKNDLPLKNQSNMQHNISTERPHIPATAAAAGGSITQ